MVFPTSTTSFPSYIGAGTTTLPYIQPMQLLRVHGIEGAKAYPMSGPNSTVALFDSDEDFFYVKSTDSANFATIRKFKFTEVVESDTASSQYVTIEEFNKFKEELLNGKQSVRKPKSAKHSAEPDDESVDEQ